MRLNIFLIKSLGQETSLSSLPCNMDVEELPNLFVSHCNVFNSFQVSVIPPENFRKPLFFWRSVEMEHWPGMGYKYFEGFQSAYFEPNLVFRECFWGISLHLAFLSGLSAFLLLSSELKASHKPFSFHFSTLPLGTSKCFFDKVFLKVSERKKKKNENMFPLILEVLRSLLILRVKGFPVKWQLYEIS